MAIIKIKGVKTYTSKGKTYSYHRDSGRRIKAEVGTPDFFLELAGVEAFFKNPHKVEKGGLVAWGQLVHAYTSSPKFTMELEERTRDDYRKVFDWLDRLCDMPLSGWTRGFVVQLRDKAHTEKKFKFANHLLVAVSAVFTWAVKSELYPADKHPVQKVDRVKRPKDMAEANRPWEPAEWEIVIGRAKPHLLAPLLLCGLLGWREGEMIKRPKTDYDPTKGTIKRRATKSGLLVETPVPKQLKAALDAILPHNGITLLVSSRGRPWTRDGFLTSWQRFRNGLEEEGLVEPGLTIHGLRHTVATRMKEEGWDLDTIGDMLGQKSPGMPAYYAKRADLRKKLAKVVKEMD